MHSEINFNDLCIYYVYCKFSGKVNQKKNFFHSLSLLLFLELALRGIVTRADNKWTYLQELITLRIIMANIVGCGMVTVQVW